MAVYSQSGLPPTREVLKPLPVGSLQVEQLDWQQGDGRHPSGRARRLSSNRLLSFRPLRAGSLL